MKEVMQMAKEFRRNYGLARGVVRLGRIAAILFALEGMGWLKR